ncbi:hypothetical protein Dimus_027695, partial [Dionaea muscipula]
QGYHIFDLYTTELEQHPVFLNGCRARRPGNESDNIMLLSLENQPLQTLENPQTPLISQNPQNSENPQTPQTPTPTEIPDGQPYVEMEFDSMEKARDYYEDYGKNQ